MPQATNFVLKNAANVDKTFALAAPASGNSAASWYLREGANVAVFGSIEISSSGSRQKGTREVKTTLKLPAPVTDSTGVTRPAGSAFVEIRVVQPNVVPDSVRDDFGAYLKGLVASAQFQDAIKVGFAPT